MAERGLVIGARVASGAVAAGVAVVTILAVGLLPLPTLGVAPRTVTVEPAPADQVRVCPGAAVRIGDATGQTADAAFTMGLPTVTATVVGGELRRERLASADAAAVDAAAPEVLRVPPAEGAGVAGAQAQAVDAPDFRGLSAASCGEPSGSTWLVGGATTVGRTTLLVLANPTEVAARVSLEIFGEDGPVVAPGMTGIDVPAGAQRVLSLAGFAPGVTAPVVHVSARGGRVVANLQHSIVRGLDSVGVETAGASAEPSATLVVPGVRIVDAVGVSRASALAGWEDVGPAVRVANPGTVAVPSTVRVVPNADPGDETSFQIELPAGSAREVPLDAGDREGEHAHGLEDGEYTVYVDADVAVVAGVRVSTAVDTGDAGETPDALLAAPPSDLAWFPAATPLGASTLFAVPEGPSPVVSIVNPTGVAVVLRLAAVGSDAVPVTVPVPANGSTSVSVAAGVFELSGAEGVAVSVSLAGPAAIAAFAVAPPRPLAGAIVVHPD